MFVIRALPISVIDIRNPIVSVISKLCNAMFISKSARGCLVCVHLCVKERSRPQELSTGVWDWPIRLGFQFRFAESFVEVVKGAVRL